MPIKYCLFLLLSSFVFNASSQDVDESKEYKNRLSFSQYYVSSRGNFKSTDGDNHKAGYAKKGTSLGLSYQIHLSKHNNLVFRFLTSDHAFNEDGFRKAIFEENYQNQMVSSEGYKVHSLTFGYKASLGSEFVKFTIHPFFGYSKMIFGELNASAKIPSRFVKIENGRIYYYRAFDFEGKHEESDPIGALIYGINGGVEFNLGERITFMIEYGISSSTYEIETEFTTNDESFGVYYDKFSIHYSVINIGAGLGINF